MRLKLFVLWLRLAEAVRKDRGQELDEELDSHLTLLRDRFIRQGMTAKEAHDAARRQFGSVTQIKEQFHDAGRWSAPDRILNDLGYAFRILRQSPTFAVAAVLTIGVAIAGSTLMFSAIKAVLLTPLPYREPDRLVLISMENSRNLATFTPMRFDQMRIGVQSSEGIGAYGLPQNSILTAGAQSEQLAVARVSANFLQILGVNPTLGRGFTPEEDVPGGPAVVMISTNLWRRRFGSDPAIAGKVATLDSVAFTIAGVLPAEFAFPSDGIDVWMTRPSEWAGIPSQAWSRTATLTGFARLRPDADTSKLSAELDVKNQQYAAAFPAMPDAKPGATVRVERLADALVATVRRPLWVLSAAVLFVLLTGCANVASLTLARGAVRSREFAVRAALGASRGRLIMQLVTESLVLATIGGAFGVCAAFGLAHAVARIGDLFLRRGGAIRLDGMVLAFGLGLSIVTGVLFGLFPAIAISRPDLGVTLKERLGQAGAPQGSFGARRILVVGQVTLSIILLIGAALMIKSFARLRAVDPGFHSCNLLTAQIALPPARYDTGRKITAFFEELTQRVTALPGVQSASIARTIPTTPYALIALQVAEQAPVAFAERPLGQLQTIGEGYFQTLGIALKRGRQLTEQDFKGSRPVLMINESLAKRFWPDYPAGRDPVGQHLQIGASKAQVEIVGISADVREAGAALKVVPEVYLPSRFSPAQTAYLVVRTKGDPLRFTELIRNRVFELDRDQGISKVRTMDSLLNESLGTPRLTMTLLGSFSAVALLLAVIGIYGVIAFSVAQRTQEIGIRGALGAEKADILRLFLAQGLKMAATGLAIGLMGALGLTRLMESLLFEVSPTDPWIFTATALLIVLVTFVGTYIPARHAARVDPMRVLR
jgi:predicted permease